MSKRRRKNHRGILKLILSIVLFALLVYADKIGLLTFIDKDISGLSGDSVAIDAFYSIGENNLERAHDAKIRESVSDNINIESGKINIIFFYVGQADCSLIIEDGHAILIDAGNSEDGENIVTAIKALGISKLDMVIGTHVHEDHIGGMRYIINNFEVGKFFLPYNGTSTLSFYKKLLKTLSEKNMSITQANVGDKYNLGNMNIEIMSVDNSDPENINLESICTQITYGNEKYLFMGDAEKENEISRKWDDIDVLKVGHHGSNTSSSNAFLNQIRPEISIIQVRQR